MPIYPENFVANSLSGTILVTNGFANVTLPTNPFALEGDKNFVIKLRKGGINGLVIATSPTITVRDLSQFVSLTANVSTVAEGNLVSFTLVTANAADGSNVFYSVFPVTANVTASDFVGANVGKATIINNQATFALFANADYSLINETGETFRVQLRENSPTGNIIYNTSNVVITDFYKRVNVFGFTESARSIAEGSSVTFTVSAHNITTGTLLYYYTSGNADIAGANTGSVVMNSVSNTITITTASTIPANQSRLFNLVLSESSLGAPIATSNAITVVDSALAYLNATGGTVSTIDGFRIHTFNSSDIFGITNLSTASLKSLDILSVAGGGGGGRGRGSGGGGGGFVFQPGITADANLTVVIGAGGSGANVNTLKFGANTTVSGGSVNIISVGGGGGGGGSGWGGPATPGGSGGGGIFTGYPAPIAAGSGFGFPSPTQQGYPGGAEAGGGGGAGQAGFPGNPATPSPTIANGGGGRPSTITGANVMYAGGGGGKSEGGSFNGRPGGAGGGGASAPENPPAATTGFSGTVNSGGGGGAGNEWNASAGGNGGSGVVIIRYPWRPPAFFSSVTANVAGANAGSSAFFVVNTAFANATTLFYDTVGNVTSSNFVGGNTGSFTITSNATVISLATTNSIPAGETRFFALRIREDSVTGNIVLISSNVTIIDANSSVFIQATGGNVFTLGGYRTHIFTSSNNFAVTNAGIFGGNVEYLVVGGGGSGGTGYYGGGGGAGGFVENTSLLTSGTYTITVGAGGVGTTIQTNRGGNGSNSTISSSSPTFVTITALGGGGGGSRNNDATGVDTSASGAAGGSGGGVGFSYPGTSTPQSAKGGDALQPSHPSGGFGNKGGGRASPALGDRRDGQGGGGAGAAASDDQNNDDGGVGRQSSITGTAVYYAGGGGGTYDGGAVPGAGGLGGGAPGGSNAPPVAANVNTGGGGGGGSGNNVQGSSGGSGIVIIRYPFA